MMKQAEMIKSMSDKELRRQLLLSQAAFFIVSMLLSTFIFRISLASWLDYFILDYQQILLYGVLTAIIIVLFEVFLYELLPEHYFDDGGINERIFKNQSLANIILICIIVAIAEEFLFRGVIQTTFGYIFASSLFVIVHVRYLKKPVLLIVVTFVSFFIGYLFEVTGNLLVTITFHFVVNFLLGLYIRYKKSEVA